MKLAMYSGEFYFYIFPQNSVKLCKIMIYLQSCNKKKENQHSEKLKKFYNNNHGLPKIQKGYLNQPPIVKQDST